MLGHYSREEKHKFIIFSVVGILATLVLSGVFFSLFSSKKDIEMKNSAVQIDQSKAQALKDSAEVVVQYVKSLSELETEIKSLPADESIVDKVQASLFAMRVPKEMLDKHLPAVFNVGKLKEEKDIVIANEEVKKIVDGLLVEAKRIK